VIEVGTLAPDFTLVTTRGTSLRLSDFRERQRVLLLFYPRNLAGG
jgi:peroxiredoxin